MDNLNNLLDDLARLQYRLDMLNDDPVGLTDLSMAEHHLIEAQGYIESHLDEVAEED